MVWPSILDFMPYLAVTRGVNLCLKFILALPAWIMRLRLIPHLLMLPLVSSALGLLPLQLTFLNLLSASSHRQQPPFFTGLKICWVTSTPHPPPSSPSRFPTLPPHSHPLGTYRKWAEEEGKRRWRGVAAAADVTRLTGLARKWTHFSSCLYPPSR